MLAIAHRLGYAGLIPFVGLAAQVSNPDAVSAFMAYSAVILSFLGGVHWGVAMRDQPFASDARLVVCMLPSLFAWLALLLPLNLGLWVALIAFLVWWAWDRTQIEDADYRRLRTHLTVVVSLCHIWLITQTGSFLS